ncbi:MAG: radical SAM protein, partial [Atopobiaceae bacterium]
MEWHGPIIRPQTDADSLFIEVTAGCTHNSCTFCNFYKDTPLWVATDDEIEEQLQEAKREIPRVSKIWASGGNPFALSAKRLIGIGDLFRKYYPEATVSTYARIDDFKRKSVDDLKEIKAHGIDEVMIGIETGDDEALAFVNKGYTAADIVRECQKLDEAGFAYRMIYLGGLLGAGRLVESAKRSAEVLNQIHPYYMIYTNVAVLPGTKLFDQKLSGEFTEATEKERLQEMRELIN